MQCLTVSQGPADRTKFRHSPKLFNLETLAGCRGWATQLRDAVQDLVTGPTTSPGSQNCSATFPELQARRSDRGIVLCAGCMCQPLIPRRVVERVALSPLLLSESNASECSRAKSCLMGFAEVCTDAACRAWLTI